MKSTISAKELRSSLPQVVNEVRRGGQFTVLYRSRPAFQIVPVGEMVQSHGALEDDPIYRAPALGRSSDGKTAADHDEFVYRR